MIVASGPLAPLLDFASSTGSLDFSRNPDDHHFTMTNAMLSTSLGTSAETAEELKICQVALNMLRRFASIPYTREDFLPKAAPFIWPTLVSQKYVT